MERIGVDIAAAGSTGWSASILQPATAMAPSNTTTTAASAGRRKDLG
jgi:hypothetical protein